MNNKLNNDEASAQAEAFLRTLIVEAMRAQKITQAEVAERTGLHQSSVARTLGGKYAASFQTYVRILTAVNLRLEFAQIVPGDWMERAMAELGRRRPADRDN